MWGAIRQSRGRPPPQCRQGRVPLVHLEGGALAELGGALGALEGLGPRVGPLVQRQRRLGAQRLAALWTYVALSASLVNLAKTVTKKQIHIDMDIDIDT